MSTVANLSCGPGDGPNLDPWPLLGWIPGIGVVTEDKQIKIEQIKHMHDATMGAEDIAKQLGTTIDHVRQALSYAASQGIQKTS